MKRGITLITLMVMIAIILIISTTVVVSSVSILNSSRLLKFGTEISYVQSLVDSYSKYNNGNLPVSDIVSLDVSNVNNDDLNQFLEEDIVDGKITLNKFDSSLFEGIDLFYGNEKGSDKTDIYAVSPKTNRVYYLKGVNASGKKYFTLTDNLKEKIGYTDDKNLVDKDGILFIPSTIEWTNKGITTIIKVPQDYTNVSVLVDTTTLTISSTSNGYNVYRVDGVNDNYKLRVNYTKNDENLYQEYYINKYDSEDPIISITNIQDFISEEGKNVVLTIDAKDTLSGIKTLKYEIEKIAQNDIKSYFKNSGINIQNGSVKLNKYVSQVTIYAEDNAGNSIYLYKDIPTILDENDYIKKGLLLQYDGINNTGNGHSNVATSWKDLSGNGNDGIINGTDDSSWADSYIHLDGVDDIIYTMMKTSGKDCTIELTAKFINGKYMLRTDAGLRTYMYFEWAMKGEKTAAALRFNNYDYNLGTRVLKYYTENDVSSFVTYYNNSKSEELTFSGTESGSYVCLGSNNPYSISEPCSEDIYSVRIYDRALTDSEIKQNYLVDKARFGI